MHNKISVRSGNLQNTQFSGEHLRHFDHCMFFTKNMIVVEFDVLIWCVVLITTLPMKITFLFKFSQGNVFICLLMKCMVWSTSTNSRHCV
jgi:hypothetical protein